MRVKSDRPCRPTEAMVAEKPEDKSAPGMPPGGMGGMGGMI